MNISFIGDVMLGRFVGEKYKSTKYDIVSSSIIEHINKSDFTIANLESPIIDPETEYDDHHLKFLANSDILNQFKWVDCFSLSNNHINDCGVVGMEHTMATLDRLGIGWNGLFTNEYTPFLIEKDNTKIAIVTCDDLMNMEFAIDCPWKTLRVGDELIPNVINKYSKLGYFVILYAHVGMLFTRFPSPAIREYLHEMADSGAKLIITVHSHALGGAEKYKDALIIHSLGDFVMDGNSFRRRQNCILDVEIENNLLTNWKMTPAMINSDLQTVFADIKTEGKQRRSFSYVSEMLIKHRDNYMSYYKKQYKKEMMTHSLSTLSFLLRTKGVFGMIKLVFVRISDVLGMVKRVSSDRSNMRYDSDIDIEKGRHSNNSIK